MTMDGCNFLFEYVEKNVIFYDIMILTYYTRVLNSTRTKRVFIWSAVMAPLYRAPCLRHARSGSCRNKKGGATQVHSP